MVSSSSTDTRGQVCLSSFLILMGLQVGEDANPRPEYFRAVWAWMDSRDCRFGWNLFGGSNLLSASALVFCNTTVILIILCRSILDTFFPAPPVSCCGLLGVKAYVAFLEVCFHLVFAPFLLASWGTLSLNKLQVVDLFR